MGAQQHVLQPVPNFLVAVIVDLGVLRNPGIVDQNIEPAEMFRHLPHHRLDRRGIGQVQGPARGAEAGVGDLGDDRLDTVCVDVCDCNMRALVGEQMRRRPAHAVRRPGDQRHLAGDRAVQFRQFRHRFLPSARRYPAAGSP